METNELSDKIIGAAIRVHKELGPGLLESIYEEAICLELEDLKLNYDKQLKIPLYYKNRQLKNHFRLDLLVENEIIIEIKSVEQILDVHHAQLLSYLRLTHKKVGLLLNFNTALMKNGLKRIVNNY